MKTRILRNRTYRDIAYKEGQAGHAVRCHVHDCWSFSFVLSGSTVVTVGTEKFRLHGNQFLAIPAHVPHLCDPRDRDNFRFAVIYLPEPLLEERDGRLFRHCFSGSCSESDLAELADRLREAGDYAALGTALDLLEVTLGKSEMKPIAVSLSDISLKADSLCLSRDNSLSRYQRYHRNCRRYGMGDKNMEMILRIEAAKEGLEKGDPLVHIAQDCGFYDQSHFTKTFKQYTGLTPLQFRN